MKEDPILPGADVLKRDIDRYRPAPRECAFWWLGQLGFALKLGDTVIYLDPYLTDKPARLMRPLLRSADLANARWVFGSHDHSDHIDRPVWPAVAAASPQAQFVVPELLRERLARETGIPPNRFVGLDDGRSVSIDGFRLTGVAAAHELLQPDPATGRHPSLGVVIEGHGLTLYHAGDTCIYEGLQTRLRAWRFDVVFLSINGRDAERLRRGCIGNMTYQEAADLAGALEPRLTVPGHFGMFAGNTVEPRLFVDYMNVKYPALRVLTCEPGHRNVYRPD